MKIKKLIVSNDDLIGSVEEAAIALSLSYNKTLTLLHKQLWHKDQLKAAGSGFTISVNSYDDSTDIINLIDIPDRINFVNYQFNFNNRPVKPIKYWDIKSPSKVKYYKDDLMALGLNQLFIGQNPKSQYDGDPSNGIYHDTCQIKPKAVEEDFVTTYDMTGWYVLSSFYDAEIGNTTIYYENTIQEYEYSPEGNQIVDSVSLEDVYRYVTTENNYNTLSQLISRVTYTLDGDNINVRTITYDPDTSVVQSDTNYDTDTSSYTIPDDIVFESTYLDENNQEQTYIQQTIVTVSLFIDTQLVTYLNGSIVETINLNISQTAASLLTIDYVNLTLDHNYVQYYKVDFSQLGTVVHTESDVPYTMPTLDTSGGWGSVIYQLSLGDETSNIYIFNDGTCIQIHPPYKYGYASGDGGIDTYVNVPAKVMYLPLCYQDDGKLVQNKWDFIDQFNDQFELYIHEDNYWYIGVIPVVSFVLATFLPMIFAEFGLVATAAVPMLQLGGLLGNFGSVTGIKAFSIAGTLVSFYGGILNQTNGKLIQNFINQGFTPAAAKTIADDMVLNMSFGEVFKNYISNFGLSNLISIGSTINGIDTMLSNQSNSIDSETAQTAEEKSFGYIEESENVGMTYIQKVMNISKIPMT